MMKIELLAVGTKPPGWVEDAVGEYRKRLRDCRFSIREIKTADRKKPKSIDGYKAEEADLLLDAIDPGSTVIALDRSGRNWSTEDLAKHIERLQLESSSIQLLIGGPNGLHRRCLDRADLTWSLSNLTFPHQLVRVILAEQIYRAFSILANHPYHK